MFTRDFVAPSVNLMISTINMLFIGRAFELKVKGEPGTGYRFLYLSCPVVWLLRILVLVVWFYSLKIT